ncbi:MAG: HIT family protein [Pirellulales bacterium]|nr:HIT family protein [Pirellulales bacterium]
MAGTCPFCNIREGRVISRNAHAIAICDSFPVSPGHTLIVPVRHVASFFETTAEERSAILDLIERVRDELKKDFAPDGFNIGINVGTAAGQTIMHLHVHVIPRYRNDVPDPRGGVRLIFPEKAAYWDEEIT